MSRVSSVSVGRILNRLEALRGCPEGGAGREPRPRAVSRQQSGDPVQVAVTYVAA